MSKVERDLWDLPLNKRISSDLFHRIHEDIGRASMCWEPIPSGVFDSDTASAVAFNLCHAVADAIEAATGRSSGTHGPEGDPMKIVGRKYSSVREMVHDISSPKFAARFDEYQLLAAAKFYADRCPNLYIQAEQDEEKHHCSVIREFEARHEGEES